jgi:tetratricopeptide (TPR) repeat protein
MEYRAYNHFAVRGGWDDGIPTFGCGFNLRSFIFDYAYRSTDLGGYHLFSLSFRFGMSRSRRREEQRIQREAEMRRELDAQMNRFENQYITGALTAGKTSLEAGDYEEAIEQFQRVLLWSPDDSIAAEGTERANALLLVARGDSLMGEDEHAAALFAYRRAHGHNPTSEIDRKIGLCEQRIEEAEDRIRVIDRIMDRSIELFAEREWHDAARGFEKILDLEPGHAAAESYLQKTRKRITEDRQRVLTRADNLIASGRYGEALVALRTGLESFPGEAAAFEERIARVESLQSSAASARRLQRERDAAVPAEVSEELRDRYVKGVNAFRSNDFTTAIAHWEDVWKKHPRFEKVEEYLVKAYQFHGMNLYSRNRYHEALEVWAKILDVDRDNEKALRYIQRTRVELERFEGLTN